MGSDDSDPPQRIWRIGDPRPHLLDPIVGQTEDTIAAFLQKCVVGDEVIIRSTQGGHLLYQKAKVVGVNPGKVYTNVQTPWSGPCWYTKHGRNARHPFSQSHLVEPTEAVLRVATDSSHPHVGGLRMEIAHLPRLGEKPES
jgi:hypothetical protein